LGRVDVEQSQELGLEVSGLGDGGCLSAGCGDQSEVAEGLEEESSGGLSGSAAVDVVADHLGVGGGVAADFAFDEAGDQQG